MSLNLDNFSDSSSAFKNIGSGQPDLSEYILANPNLQAFENHEVTSNNSASSESADARETESSGWVLPSLELFDSQSKLNGKPDENEKKSSGEIVSNPGDFNEDEIEEHESSVPLKQKDDDTQECKAPDGSIITKNKDGSVELKDKDGSTLIVKKDPTPHVTVIGKDGNKQVYDKFPDDYKDYGKDGPTLKLRLRDGGTSIYTLPDGRSIGFANSISDINQGFSFGTSAGVAVSTFTNHKRDTVRFRWSTQK